MTSMDFHIWNEQQEFRFFLWYVSYFIVAYRLGILYLEKLKQRLKKILKYFDVKLYIA